MRAALQVLRMESVRKEWARSFQQENAPNKEDILFSTTENPVKIRLKKIFRGFFEKDGLILDGGCSEGTWCYYLENRGFSTIGIDIVPDAISRANRIGKQTGIRAIFIVGDVTLLPFRDGVLRGYISLGVVEHFRFIEEVERAFVEATRSLAPGARAFVAVHGPFVVLRNSLSLLITQGKIGYYHRYLSRGSIEKYLLSGSMRVVKSKYERG